MSGTKRILFLVPYPIGQAPSQRFRFEQYLPFLTKSGFDITISSFLDLSAWRILYRKGNFPGKVVGLIRGYLRRLSDLISLYRYDMVFVHREASPFGPPWIEWVVARLFRIPMLFDFDDAIWLPNTSRSNSALASKMKSFSKTATICKWSHAVIVGNEYLAAYARLHNQNVFVIPTTIDTVGLHNAVVKHENARLVVGWTGSHSTLPLLLPLLPVLKRLRQEVDFELRVVCDEDPGLDLSGVVFVPWTKEDEIEQLMKFDVGIMPLPDNQWTRGKCGFKALQYMSLGIPALVSPVGVNAEIVDHGINGLHCTTDEDWLQGLRRLSEDRAFLKSLAVHCRPKVEQYYSVNSQAGRYLSVLQSTLKP
ncbi:MAG: glycosyltransferase family 4 protein [Bacteroidota bacterium]